MDDQLKSTTSLVRMTDQQVTNTEEVQMDVTDDFDPFSGVVECVEENIDVALSAPPENQWV